MEKTNTNNLRYVIYARKSSESEDRQALSIQSQIIEMKEIAKREKLAVVKIFEESKSAKAPGRPVFGEMIKLLKSKKADGILCWKIDRLARNPVDEGMVKWLLQNETIRKIKTFDRDYNPEDNVVIASIEFGMANQYIRDLSRNVKRGLAEKVRRGEYPGAPPAGYINHAKTKQLMLDPDNWRHIKKAFWLYSTGMYSVKTLSDRFFSEGLRSKTGKKVHHSTIHKILTNPIYYGWFRYNGQIHKGIHPPIISKGIFDKVQEILFPRKHAKRANKRDFVFRNFLTCGECGLKITAEVQKGHIYYRCTKSRGAGKCSQRYIREEDLISEIEKKLRQFSFDKEIIDLAIESAKQNGRKQYEHYTAIEKKNKFLLEKNQILQNSLVEKFVDNNIPEDIYNRKLAELRGEEATLEGKLADAKSNYRNVFEKIEQMATFVKVAPKIFKDGTNDDKKDVISVISSNIEIKDRKITGFTLAMPFVWLIKDMENAKTPRGENQGFEPLFLAKTTSKEVALSSKLRGWDSNPQPIGYTYPIVS
ncbi:MAG: recombinase family protein [Candidatus Moranbacteria bacterium]|nr:recombinase family protein [Candidatus Moranbacteria bacterium]